MNSIYNDPDLSASVTIDYFLSELQNNASSKKNRFHSTLLLLIYHMELISAPLYSQ